MAVMIKDKRASSQGLGLVLVIDDSHDYLSGPCFLIPAEHGQTIYGGSNSLWGGIAKFPGRIPKEQIIQGLKKAGQFIGKHYDDILDVINKLPSKKEEQNEATTPPLIISPPLVISPPPTSSRLPHNTLIQFLKGESKIPLEIPLPLALAGISIFFGIGFVYLVIPNISNVSMFSKGDQADMFSKITKSKRLAAIYLGLDELESGFIDGLVNETFGMVGDEPGSCDRFRTVMSTATEKPFFVCLSTKNNFYTAFRGRGICLVGGAVINDERSAINLGSMNAMSGDYKIGNFLTENLNLKFLVMGSSVLLELLSYQEIVECVSLAKDQDNATKIAKAALERNPDIDDLHVAVMFLM